jgi:putative membrane protein
VIVRNKPNVFQLFFVMRGSIVPRILPQLLFVTVLASAVAIAHDFYPAIFPEQTLAPFALLGMALSLFLGFRNNASYDRWWEARKQWGQLVVDSRSLARQATSYIDSGAEGGRESQQRLVGLAIAFSQALRHQLRGTEPWDDIERYIEPEDFDLLRQRSNIPDTLLQLIGKKLGGCRHKMLLSDWLVQSMDERMTSMAEVQGACERIKNTPLPFAYMLLVQRTAYLYCLALPLGLVASQGLATPVFCAVVAYTFFGLDALSEELEDPFGLSTNDLPLSALSRTIEIDLLELLGDENIPQQILPSKHCLN